jgi:chromosomal replication initiation ATPase DnaA
MMPGMTATGWASVVPVPEVRSALRAARRVARLPAAGTPVLTLHGPPGCGKTTVVTALLAAVAADPAGRTARSVPANDLDPDPAADPVADLAGCDLAVIEDVQHLPAAAAGAVERLLDARARRRR